MPSIKVTYTLPEELVQEARRYCIDNDLKFSQLAKRGIKEVLKNG